ncbi:adenylosuccinate lyase family protein [Variovorax rhizosphaerae]|uniref:Adenylosuccinate lyase family protein n=1 Tax=Variovorax rhizosphaerae TaxID=1836200 RepID=A0ABU8WV91_9BURK
MHIGMFESFVTRHWFNSEAKEAWSDVATLQAWLDVEVALANAQAEVGLVPLEAARRIEAKADAGLFDLERLSSDIAFAQHPFVPVLHQFEALCGEPAAGFIHWGATTQNIFDTASSLQMMKTHTLLTGHLDAAIEALCALAARHKHTAQAGRTHGQHALPMTFGFKVAAWVDELDRDRRRLAERCKDSFVASMGGAIGTYAACGPLGRAVEAGMAARLGLQPAGMAMRSSYDRVNDYVSALGLLMGTVEKIAQDVVFMQRTEIGEVSEAFHLGKVGSSTMAQKRNPATALLLTSLTRLLRARIPAMLASMVRLDEGDSSATNLCEALLPEIAIIGVSVAETLAGLSRGLVVNPDAMLRNLDVSNGLIASEALMMRLAQTMGRHEAHQLLYDAAQRAQTERIPYIAAIEQHPLLAAHQLPENWAEALTPQNYVGACAELVDDAIERAGRQR